MIISESKLDKTIPTNLIKIPGFHEPLRHDRSVNGRHGGGVLMYISEKLAFQQKHEFQSEFFEHIWADVRVNGQTFSINGLYRPPDEDADSHELFLKTTENILIQMNNYKKAKYHILSGDFNFGNIYCKAPPLQSKPLDTRASDLFASYGFHQLIDIPTRLTEDTMSLISLIYINNPDDVVCHGTVHKIADHDGVFVSLNEKNSKATTQK